MAETSQRVALITGGGSGIGRATAVQLAEAGFVVALVGRREQPLLDTVNTIKRTGGLGHAFQADMTDPNSIERLAQQIHAQFASIDVLVNNAGYSSIIRSARYIDAAEWRSVMDVNTLGPAMLTRAVLPAMIERRRGHIVTVSSLAAIHPSVMAGAVYSAAKSAVRSYMQTLAQEVSEYHIRCTTVFPGEVDTDILDNRALIPDRSARDLMMMPEDIATAIRMAVLLPERATVSEIVLNATIPRDLSADIQAAKNKRTID